MNKGLLLAGTVLVFSGIWVLPVCDTSEARYAEVAREMVASGEWLIPSRMGEVHLSKPPLTYWLSALSLKAFGPTAWAARLPAALAFLATVWIAADLGRRLWRASSGGSGAGWALLFSALPLGASNVLTTDTLLALFETAAVWCAWRSLAAADEKSGRRWALGLHASLALAFLTKGPPGLLAALALVPFAIRRRGTLPFRRLISPAGVLLFAVLALPWFISVAWKVPGAMSYWLQTETLERISEGLHRNMPFYLYFPILLGGSLPAGLLLPWAIRRLWREFRGKGPDAAPAELLFWWTAVPLVVFCCAGSRLPLYLLPLFPPLAIAAGRRLEEILARRKMSAPGAASVVLAACGLWVGARLLVTASPAIQTFLDLHPDPRPAVEAILKDAGRIGREPQVFATSPPMSFAGGGLTFYLGKAVDRLNIRPNSEPSPFEAPARPAREVLERPVPAATAQYIVVTEQKVALFEERACAAGASGRWILSEGRLHVWRREP